MLLDFLRVWRKRRWDIPPRGVAHLRPPSSVSSRTATKKLLSSSFFPEKQEDIKEALFSFLVQWHVGGREPGTAWDI